MNDHGFFKPRRIGHVNLWVGSLAASQHFYNQVCGLHLDFWEPDLKAAFVGTGHTHHDVAMMEKTNGEARYGRNGFLQLPAGIGYTAGLNHIAWEIETEAELVSVFENLHKAGVRTSETVDHQIARSVYMADPDGNGLEYTIDSVPDWRAVVQGEVDLITEGWDIAASACSTTSLTSETPLLLQVDAAPVHPERLLHAVLTTTDIAGMREFYTGIGGLEIVGSALGGDVIWLRGSRSDYPDSLVLVKSDTSRYHHASFELKDDAAFESALAQLAAAGIAVTHQVEEAWKRSFFLSDPDGMQVEYQLRRHGEREITSADDVAYLV
jgi:catechol 2,3-dioxygenase